VYGVLVASPWNADVIWGARCGETARRVLLGETGSRGHAYSVRRRRESAYDRKAPPGLPSSRLVSTNPFDRWLAANYPQVPFERYADDVIAHCRTERQAQEMRKAIAARLQSCGLELHPEKTKIVYCKDDSRKKTYPNETFDFLGYAFRPRSSMTRKGKFFLNFSPAVSNQAAKAIRDTFRSWKLPQRSDKVIDDLSRMFNPIIRGWIQYYGRYYHSALYPTMRELNRDLALWAKRKYKKLRSHLRKAKHWIACISRRALALFAHWQMGARRGSPMEAV